MLPEFYQRYLKSKHKRAVLVWASQAHCEIHRDDVKVGDVFVYCLPGDEVKIKNLLKQL
mgnify:FL=1